MSFQGYYYLHTNGELIHKAHADVCDFRESDFVRAFWPIDASDRENAWNILVEALASGASKARIQELAAKISAEMNAVYGPFPSTEKGAYELMCAVQRATGKTIGDMVAAALAA